MTPITDPPTDSPRETIEPPLQMAIERRTRLSLYEFRNNYLIPNRPVVISDALARWPAVRKWTPAMFAARYPKRIITFRDGTRLSMRAFIDRVRTSSATVPAPSWTNAPLREHFPELFEDIDPQLEYLSPNWAERRYLHPGMAAALHRGAEIELHIGGKGAGFPLLHRDGLSTHAFLMQIHGGKRYWIWSPSESPYLYPDRDLPNMSPIRDVENPDLARYPLFAQARGSSFTLSPGELLFVPSRWWHTATLESPSITLSVNTVNAWNWPNLAEDMTRNASGVGWLVKSAYLAGAGAINGWVDALAGM